MLPSDELADKLVGVSEIFTFEDLEKLGLPNEIAVQRREPNAVRLAEAWLALPELLKQELCGQPPQPAYLRPPHVTKAKQGHPLLRSGKD